MKKEYIKYGSLLIVFTMIILFVYPTIYQYDKFNQKIPVRINRITGTAEMLFQDGWQKAESSDKTTEPPKISEMEQFKNDMKIKIDTDEKILKEQIKNEILTSIKKQISDLENAKLDPDNKFGIGSTKDEVKKIMGVPDEITLGGFQWYYGRSYINFTGNPPIVTQYNNLGNNLKVK